MKVKNDRKLNPRLRKQIQGLRGMIVGAAELHSVPKRFKITPDPTHPRMDITDRTTGKTSKISLYAYGQVRKLLSDLFGA